MLHCHSFQFFFIFFRLQSNKKKMKLPHFIGVNNVKTVWVCWKSESFNILHHGKSPFYAMIGNGRTETFCS